MDVETKTDNSAVKFNKRKRTYRPRAVTEDSQAVEKAHEQPVAVSPTAAAAAAAAESSSHQLPTTQQSGDTPIPNAPLTDLLRQRKLSKSRRRLGIEFSRNSIPHHGRPATPEREETSLSLQPNPDTDGASALAQARFAPQTGAVADVNNRHMMSFVDSEMAKIRQGPTHPSALPTRRLENDQSNPAPNLSSLPHRQPAALGQIQEIDLGPEATSKNIQMTEMATRRLANGQPLLESSLDVKPRKSRRRRGSHDLKRDQVVEAFLHENKLDLYDEGDDAPQEVGEDAADDLIAEQFQRDFLDAIQSRNKLNRKRAATTQKKGQVDEKARGPKLGGSRSARAAMHAAGKVKPGPAKR